VARVNACDWIWRNKDYGIWGWMALKQGICAMIPPLHTLFRVVLVSFAWGSLLFIGLATIWKLVCLWQEGWEKALFAH